MTALTSPNNEAAATQVEAMLEKLWASGREATLERLEVVEDAIALRLLSDDDVNLDEAIAAAHKLAGTLGMFGLPNGSAIAREIELLLEDGDLELVGLVYASDLLVQLRTTIESRDEVTIDQGDQQGDELEQASRPAGLDHPSGSEMVLLGGSRSYLESLEHGVKAYDYRVRRQTNWSYGPGAGSKRVVVVDVASYSSTVEIPASPIDDPDLYVAVGVPSEAVDRLDVASRSFDLVFTDEIPPERAVERIIDTMERRSASHRLAVLTGSDDLVAELTEGLPTWQIDALAADESLSSHLTHYDFTLVDFGSLMNCGMRPTDLCRAICTGGRGLPNEVVVLLGEGQDEAPLLIELLRHGVRDIVTFEERPRLSRLLIGHTMRIRRNDYGARRREEVEATTSERLTDRIEQALEADRVLSVVAFTARARDLTLTPEVVDSRIRRMVQRKVRPEDLMGADDGTYVVAAEIDRVAALERMRLLADEFRKADIEVEFGSAVLVEHGTTASELIDHAIDVAGTAEAIVNTQVGTVLVVEDDDLVAELLNDLLSNQGYSVERVADGNTGAAVLTDPKRVDGFRLVLLDVSLPGLDGFAILRRMRQAETIGRAPVVLLTARAAEEEVLEGLELGAVDYIAKPFSPHVLMRRLERAMNR